MLNNPVVSNPKDYVVVTFHNTTDFDFTPDQGCMFDGRPINGSSGRGIVAGESKMLPYHIGKRLSVNLAKRVLNTSPAATVDQAGIPTGVAVWSQEALDTLANTFVTEEYSDVKPAAQTETDKLMAKMAELEKFVRESAAKGAPTEPAAEATTVSAADFKNKQEVIAELEKRGIQHDKRQPKAELEKLLA